MNRRGLRAGEVAARRLEDLDWQRGEITVQGNGKRHELLLLPANVGEAVWAHLSASRVLDADLGALTMRPWRRLPR